MLGNESIHFNINYSELEGLLPEATKDKKGLMPINFSKFLIDNIFPNVERNKLYKAFNLKQYGLGVLVLLYGSVTNKNINTVMFLLNNRSQGSLSVITKKIITTDSSQYTIYAKYNSDNSIDVYFKGYNDAYVTLEYFWLIRPESYKVTVYNAVDDTITESNLSAITL